MFAYTQPGPCAVSAMGQVDIPCGTSLGACESCPGGVCQAQPSQLPFRSSASVWICLRGSLVPPGYSSQQQCWRWRGTRSSPCSLQGWSVMGPWAALRLPGAGTSTHLGPAGALGPGHSMGPGRTSQDSGWVPWATAEEKPSAFGVLRGCPVSSCSVVGQDLSSHCAGRNKPFLSCQRLAGWLCFQLPASAALPEPADNNLLLQQGSSPRSVG